MSVRERLEDAKILWDKGRKQGAWIQVLIAAAAPSRLRFPAKKDGDAFREFIREVTPTIVSGVAPAIPGGIRVIFNAETRTRCRLIKSCTNISDAIYCMRRSCPQTYAYLNLGW